MHYRIPTLLLTIFCSALLFAQEKQVAFDFLSSDDIHELTLHTDLNQLIKKKYKEEYQPAVLEIMRSEASEKIDLKIRARGNIRKEVCYFPPIRLKFPKSEYEYHKIKWVNVCRDSDMFEGILLKEYLCYKMFSLFTELSCRVKLLKVNYNDTAGKFKPFVRYAFVIENQDQLADRIGGRVYEPKILKKNLLQKDYLDLFTFFQYMIGNTDWAFGNRHNMEIITNPASGKLLSVPYDFDYCGLVSAPYAMPHESLPITNVTVRHNKSYCMEIEDCQALCALYLDKKAEIIAECKKVDLDPKVEAKLIRYLEDFFELLEKPKSTERTFVKNCQNPPVN